MNITSDNITIRDWQEKDLPTERYWLDPTHKWHETNGPYYPDMTQDQIDKRISRFENMIMTNSFPEIRRNMAIATADEDELIGSVSWYYQSEETDWISIGICIYDPEYWGKSIGYHALGLWCQYLFDHCRSIARLDIRTWSGNTGMMKLSEKLGFKLEAVFRNARIVNGQYFDSIGYGILREEWVDTYKTGFPG